MKATVEAKMNAKRKREEDSAARTQIHEQNLLTKDTFKILGKARIFDTYEKTQHAGSIF